VFGLADGLKASSFSSLLPVWFDKLPLAEQGLVWLQPTLLVLLLAAAYDRLRSAESIKTAS
jgi:LIVCS family branched-chain amino acid:cation transporter